MNYKVVSKSVQTSSNPLIDWIIPCIKIRKKLRILKINLPSLLTKLLFVSLSSHILPREFKSITKRYRTSLFNIRS